jgi:hypothetical protein
VVAIVARNRYHRVPIILGPVSSPRARLVPRLSRECLVLVLFLIFPVGARERIRRM